MIVITGANGFVGSHLAQHLVSGGYDVHGLVREGRGDVVREAGAEPVEVDYLDTEVLEEVVDGADAVFHFAGAVYTDDYQTNTMEPARNVIDAAERAGSRLVFNSGLGVTRYGMDEHATNSYFHAKRSIEELISRASLDSVIFRPSTMIGGGITEDEITGGYAEKIRSGESINLVPGSRFQPVWIRDAVLIYEKCIDGHDGIYDLAGPEIITYEEYAELVAEAIGEEAEIRRITEAELRHHYTEELVDVFLLQVTGDNETIEEEFGTELHTPREAVNSMLTD